MWSGGHAEPGLIAVGKSVALSTHHRFATSLFALSTARSTMTATCA
jgi:hypothetical protein